LTQTLLIASENPGKIEEIKSILSILDITVLSASELNLTLNVRENGDTYARNAQLKSFAYTKASGLPSLADDSGLEVDSLDGAPGLFSARFSPKLGATDADRRSYLLQKLAGKPHPWTAHFHCTAVIAFPDHRLAEMTGRCDGIIIPEERGSGGFGYDPIFYIPEHNATMAELPSSIKNKISHRARALQAMLPYIKNNF